MYAVIGPRLSAAVFGACADLKHLISTV